MHLDGVGEFFEGMAADEEAQHLALGGEAGAAVPGFDVFGHPPVLAEAGQFRVVEEAGHARVATAPGCGGDGIGKALQQGRAVGFQAVEGAGLDERFPDPAVGLLEIRALQRVEEILEPALGLAGLENGLQGRVSQSLDGGKAESDLPVSRRREIERGFVDVGAQHLDAPLPGILHILRHVVRAARLGGQQARHELHGEVGLQVGGFVGHHGVGRTVALVEAVAREVLDEVEHLRDLGLFVAPGGAPLDEAGLLLGHLLLVLLAHGAAQHIGLAQGIPGHEAGDLHHLFLVEDHTVGGRQDRLQIREEVGHGLAAVAAVHVRGAHARAQGARAEEGVERDQVVEAVGAQLAQQLLHATGFELEHAIGIARGEELEGLPVVEGADGGHVLGLAVAPRDDLLGLRDLGERLQAQEIHFQQARALGLDHGVLHHHLLVLVHRERRELGELVGGDDDPRRMDAGVAGQALKARGDIEDVLHLGIGLVEPPQLVALLEGLTDGHGLAGLLGHQLGEVIGEGEILFEDPRHILDHGLGLELVDGDDVADLVLAIFLGDVVDDFLAPVAAEVDVHIRHGHALGVQEALEEQVVLHGIDVRDPHGPGHDAAGGRSAAGPHGHAHLPGLADEVPDHQEVAREAHLQDHVQLKGQPLPVFLLRVLEHALLPEGAAFRQPLLERILGHMHEVGFQVVALGHGKARRDGLPRDGEELHLGGDLEGALQVLGVVGEHGPHLLGRLHVELVRGEAHALLLGLGGLRADAKQRIVQVGVLVVEVVGIVRGHQGDAQLLRQLLLVGDDLLLLVEALILDLQVEVLAEDVAEVTGYALGLIQAVLEDAGLHLAAQAGGKPDEPLAVFAEKVLIDAGLVIEAFGETRGHQFGKVREAHRILGQQHQVVARVPGSAGIHAVLQALLARAVLRLQLPVEAGLGGDIDLAAEDGLHGPVAFGVHGLFAGVEELHHAEHVSVVGDSHGRHAGGPALLDEIGDAREAVEERMLGVQMQMGEAHGPILRWMPNFRASAAGSAPGPPR